MIVVDEHDAPETSQKATSQLVNGVQTPSRSNQHSLVSIPPQLELVAYDPPPRYELSPTENSPLYCRSAPLYHTSNPHHVKARARRRFRRALLFSVSLILILNAIVFGMRHSLFRKSYESHPPSPSNNTVPPVFIQLPHSPLVPSDYAVIGVPLGCTSEGNLTWTITSSQFSVYSAHINYTIEPKESFYLKSPLSFANDFGTVAFLHHDKPVIQVLVSASVDSLDALEISDLCLTKGPNSWTFFVSQSPKTITSRIFLSFEVRLPRPGMSPLRHVGSTMNNYDHTIGVEGEEFHIDTLRIVTDRGAVRLETLVSRQVDIVGGMSRVSGNVKATEFVYITNYGNSINVDVDLDAQNASTTPGVNLLGMVGPMVANIAVTPPPPEAQLGLINVTAINKASSVDVNLLLAESTVPYLQAIIASGLSLALGRVNFEYTGAFMVITSPEFPYHAPETTQRTPYGDIFVHVYEATSMMILGHISHDANHPERGEPSNLIVVSSDGNDASFDLRPASEIRNGASSPAFGRLW